MTVATDTNRKTFAGDAVSTSFATSPIVFFDSSDLVVTVTVDATGAATTLTENTHYSVSGGGTPAAVGTVSLAGGSSPYGAPAAGVTVTILRDVGITQGADFVQNDGSDAEVSEAAHDRLTMIAQRLDDRLDRTLHIPDGDVDGLTTVLSDSVTRALSVLGFDADGNVTLYDPASTVTAGSNVSFVRTDAGATATDLQTRGRLVLYANDFGTKMLTTPAADINLAITAANVAGGGTVVVPAGSYTLETSILHKSNVTLDLRGVTFSLATGLNAPAIKNATSMTSVSISGITNVNRVATVTTSTAHGFVAGDYVHITGATPNNYNGWHKVITTPLTTTFTYYVDKNISADSGTITVSKYVETNLKILGGKINGNALNTTGNNYGVLYEGVKDFEIDGLWVDGTYHTCIGIVSGVNGRLFRCRGDNAVHSQHNGIVLGATSPSNKYADDIEVIGCQANGNGQDGFITQLGFGQRLVACGGTYNTLDAIKLAAAWDVEVVACWGKYNTGHGLQIQASGGTRDLSVSASEFCENGESGIFISNLDASNALRNVMLSGNQCHRNGQIASSTSYGIAIESAAGTTIDRLTLIGNQMDDQARGLSFSAAGTFTNVSIIGNRAKGNTADIIFGNVDLTTLTYDANTFPTFTDGFSFTPVLTFDTPGDLNVVYAANSQIGRYVRHGDTVTAWVNIVTSTFTFSTAAGQLKVTGFPFAALSLTNFTQLGGGLGWRGITKANYTDINPYFLSGNSFVNFAACGSGQALAVISTGDMPSGGTVQLTFQITYRVPSL